MIKFYEHNPYIVKSEDKEIPQYLLDIAANPNDKLLKPPTDQYEKLNKDDKSENVTEHVAIIREAFEKSE